MAEIPHHVERFVRDACDGMEPLWRELEALQKGYVSVKRVDKRDVRPYAKWFRAQVDDFLDAANTGVVLLRESFSEFMFRTDTPSDAETTHQVDLFVGMVRRLVDIRRSAMKATPPYVWEESRNDLLLAIDALLGYVRAFFRQLRDAVESPDEDRNEDADDGLDMSEATELMECLAEWVTELHEEAFGEPDGGEDARPAPRSRSQRGGLFRALKGLARTAKKIQRSVPKEPKLRIR